MVRAHGTFWDGIAKGKGTGRHSHGWGSRPLPCGMQGALTGSRVYKGAPHAQRGRASRHEWRCRCRAGATRGMPQCPRNAQQLQHWQRLQAGRCTGTTAAGRASRLCRTHDRSSTTDSRQLLGSYLPRMIDWRSFFCLVCCSRVATGVTALRFMPLPPAAAAAAARVGPDGPAPPPCARRRRGAVGPHPGSGGGGGWRQRHEAQGGDACGHT